MLRSASKTRVSPAYALTHLGAPSSPAVARGASEGGKHEAKTPRPWPPHPPDQVRGQALGGGALRALRRMRRREANAAPAVLFIEAPASPVFPLPSRNARGWSAAWRIQRNPRFGEARAPFGERVRALRRSMAASSHPGPRLRLPSLPIPASAGTGGSAQRAPRARVVSARRAEPRGARERRLTRPERAGTASGSIIERLAMTPSMSRTSGILSQGIYPCQGRTCAGRLGRALRPYRQSESGGIAGPSAAAARLCAQFGDHQVKVSPTTGPCRSRSRARVRLPLPWV
jgi:hypothetical protein